MFLFLRFWLIKIVLVNALIVAAFYIPKGKFGVGKYQIM